MRPQGPKSLWHTPHKVYKPNLQQASKRYDFSGITGTNPTPKWNSPGVSSQLIAVVDLELCRWASARGAWCRLKHSWLSCVARGANLLLRSREPDMPAGWFFSMGDVNSVAVLGWPAELREWQTPPPHGPLEYFAPSVRPEEAKQIHILVVTDLEQWDAITFDWEPPLSRRLRGLPHEGGLVASPSGTGCAARPEILLQVASDNAWFDLNLPTIRRLAHHLKRTDVPEDSCLCDTVKVMVKPQAPSISDHALTETMLKRVTQEAIDLDEFMELEAAGCGLSSTHSGSELGVGQAMSGYSPHYPCSRASSEAPASVAVSLHRRGYCSLSVARSCGLPWLVGGDSLGKPLPICSHSRQLA